MIQAMLILEMKSEKYQVIKSRIKLPMISMAIVSGVLAGLTASISKGMTLAMGTDGFFSWGLLYFCAVGLFATLQLKSLNIAMENYDQIDIDPIYQTSIILFNMFSGAIILNE